MTLCVASFAISYLSTPALKPLYPGIEPSGVLFGARAYPGWLHQWPAEQTTPIHPCSNEFFCVYPRKLQAPL
jgi:hypothetical protein